ncbi:MAG: hypothetical protein AAF388_26795 [Bacteroidota bacterium]
MELLSFLKQKRLFTEEECISIADAFKSEVIPKGTVIQQLHGYSEKVLFIEEGLLRTFYLKDGKDITHFFFDENALIAPLNSIFFDKTEPYGWESIEACQVKSIHYTDFLQIEEQFPKLTRLLLEFAIKIVHLYSQKLDLLQFQTAYERYNLFLEMYPNLHNRVSLGSTASFLGVTQQTLSVIRAKTD